jgi:hypothetical protein
VLRAGPTSKPPIPKPDSPARNGGEEPLSVGALLPVLERGNLADASPVRLLHAHEVWRS